MTETRLEISGFTNCTSTSNPLNKINSPRHFIFLFKHVTSATSPHSQGHRSTAEICYMLQQLPSVAPSAPTLPPTTLLHAPTDLPCSTFFPSSCSSCRFLPFLYTTLLIFWANFLSLVVYLFKGLKYWAALYSVALWELNLWFNPANIWFLKHFLKIALRCYKIEGN